MSVENKSNSVLVPVVIMGQTYNVRAEEDGLYIKELAKFVDTKMSAVEEATGTSESTKVAILTALNIADELFKVQERERIDKETVVDHVTELSRKLDDALSDST